MHRHTFLKRVADKRGIPTAEAMGVNVHIEEAFRNTKPREEVIGEMAGGACALRARRDDLQS